MNLNNFFKPLRQTKVRKHVDVEPNTYKSSTYTSISFKPTVLKLTHIEQLTDDYIDEMLSSFHIYTTLPSNNFFMSNWNFLLISNGSASLRYA